MKLTTFVIASVLAIAPAISFAGCTGKSDQASSCAPGYTWSSTDGACVMTSS